MLEAVNSVLSNASYTKVVADQQSVATSYAANPDRVQQANLQAPYVSLYIKVDVNFDKALLQLRDRDTGDVVQQIPSENQLEAYRRAQEVVAPPIKYIEDATDLPEQRVASAPAPEVRAPAPAPEVRVSNTVSAATIAPAATSAPQTTSAAPQTSTVNTSA